RPSPSRPGAPPISATTCRTSGPSRPPPAGRPGPACAKGCNGCTRRAVRCRPPGAQRRASTDVARPAGRPPAAGHEMKIALVNPPWSYEGSIYFGCREPHLPLELGYARALMEADGHEVTLIDAQAEGQVDGGQGGDLAARISALAPDLA